MSEWSAARGEVGCRIVAAILDHVADGVGHPLAASVEQLGRDAQRIGDLREARELAETMVDETELSKELGLRDDVLQWIREFLTAGTNEECASAGEVDEAEEEIERLRAWFERAMGP